MLQIHKTFTKSYNQIELMKPIPLSVPMNKLVVPVGCATIKAKIHYN